MKRAFRTFAYGLLLTAATSTASAAIAVWGFHNLYCLAQTLPAFMAFYLTLAWFIHLRRTALLHNPTGGTPRAASRPEEPEHQVETLLQNPIAILVWSAGQLAVLATILYHAFGVGAKYY